MSEKDCCKRKKHRSEEEYKKLISRLNRIEGQVRGIKKMLEDDAYCPDILIQSAATVAALKSFSRTLLENHMKSCVINDVRAGKDESVDELIETLRRFM